MGYVILGWDGEDAQAAGRRGAARERHLAVISAWAEAGRLSLAVPLFRTDGAVAGSLMVLAEEDELGTREYLAEEPFARDGVWLSYQMRPFLLTPLHYAPFPSEPTPTTMTHAVVIAEDAPGMGATRQAVRAAHSARLAEFAPDGTLAFNGALLDASGAKVGSIAVTRHPSREAARAFWAEDPYVKEGVWGDMRFYLTRFAPLPYRPLPRPASPR